MLLFNIDPLTEQCYICITVFLFLQMTGIPYLETSQNLVWVQFPYFLMCFSWYSTIVSMEQRKAVMKLSLSCQSPVVEKCTRHGILSTRDSKLMYVQTANVWIVTQLHNLEKLSD